MSPPTVNSVYSQKGNRKPRAVITMTKFFGLQTVFSCCLCFVAPNKTIPEIMGPLPCRRFYTLVGFGFNFLWLFLFINNGTEFYIIIHVFVQVQWQTSGQNEYTLRKVYPQHSHRHSQHNVLGIICSRKGNFKKGPQTKTTKKDNNKMKLVPAWALRKRKRKPVMIFVDLFLFAKRYNKREEILF